MDEGLQLQQDLFYFIFKYAAKYGDVCTQEEIDKYGNMFTGEIYHIDGKYVQIMHGQGSVIRIDDKSDKIKN